MKILNYSFSAMFIFLFSLTGVGGNVTVTQNIPDIVQPGSQFTIEITVNKGTLSGFGKFNQDLPTGWTAIMGESSGGTFTFTERTVKIIWVALPTSSEFKITYKVQVSSGASGPNILTGKFNYIENGQKQTVELPEKTVTVGSQGSSTSNTQTNSPSNTSSTAPAATKPASETNTTTTPATQKPTTTAAPPSETTPSAKDLTQPSAEEVVYKVQFGVFSKPLTPDKTKGIPEVNFIQENNLYKYFSGNFSSPQAAELRRQDVAKKGFPSAIIVGYKGKVRVEVIK